jgi:septum formation protein
VDPGARLVLASASPRRVALLRAAGYDFEVRPSGVPEPAYAGGDPAAYAESLARAKAAAAGGTGEEVVVGADTIVVLDGAVLGKPADPGAATAMLRRLAGRTHRVITAVAVRRGDVVRSAHAATGVTFRRLAEREIADYVATGEPLDKAGAYAYQGGAGAFVTRLDGEADTVIGLPLALVNDLLPPALRQPHRKL